MAIDASFFFSFPTKSILGDDGHRLQRVTDAIFVDPAHSEDVFVALDESGHVNDAVDKFLRDNGPHDSAGLPLFHNVVRHHGTGLVSRRRPHDGDVVGGHLLKLDLSSRGPWPVCEWAARGAFLLRPKIIIF